MSIKASNLLEISHKITEKSKFSSTLTECHNVKMILKKEAMKDMTATLYSHLQNKMGHGWGLGTSVFVTHQFQNTPGKKSQFTKMFTVSKSTKNLCKLQT